MAQLLYSAKTADGRPTQGFVEAGSAREARDKLVARGLLEVVLHQEVAISSAQTAGLDAAALQELAALKLRLRENPGLRTVLKEVARRHAFWLAGDAVLCAYWLSTGRMAFAAFAGALLLLPLVQAAWAHRHADRYQQLVRAFALGQWADVAELAARLRQVEKITPTLAFDLDVRLASIRARQGDLPGALRAIEPWRARLAQQPGLFAARVASIHSAGSDRNGYVRLMAEACEASGGEPARALDLALAQARFGDSADAERTLATVDASLLPPQAKAFMLWTQGLIAMRQGRTESIGLLGQAAAEFLQRSASPAGWTALAFCACDHALALHAAGQSERARSTLQSVWPILSAHADQPLLQLLNQELLAAAPAAK